MRTCCMQSIERKADSIDRCKGCNDRICEACSINGMCLDCYLDDNKTEIIYSYYNEKYTGVVS